MTKQRRNEIILVVVIVVLAVGYFVCRRIQLKRYTPGHVYVVVTKDGEQYLKHDINFDITVNIEDPEKEFSNILVVKDKKVTMTEANCPDKLCVYQGTIERSGEMIVCLPHKIVVEIVDEAGNELDGTV